METQIVDNALDFMFHAAQTLWDERLPEADRLKHSTVGLMHGIELLLKSRLLNEHWSLIVNDPARFAEKKDAAKLFERGDFTSVGYEAARDRLAAYCSTMIGREADDSFLALKQLRNRYVHFFCPQPPTSVMATQLRAWHHLLRLAELGVVGHLSGKHMRRLEEIKDLMQRSEEFLDQRLGEVVGELELAKKSELLILTCPRCRRPALVAGEGTLGCHVCGDFELCPSSTAEEYASTVDGWLENPRHGVDEALVRCAECDWLACAPVGDEVARQLPEDQRLIEGQLYLCFGCGSTFDTADLQRCPLCGTPYFSNSVRDYCSDCQEMIEDRIRKD